MTRIVAAFIESRPFVPVPTDTGTIRTRGDAMTGIHFPYGRQAGSDVRLIRYRSRCSPVWRRSIPVSPGLPLPTPPDRVRLPAHPENPPARHDAHRWENP